MERPDINSKLLLDRKLSFEFFSFVCQRKYMTCANVILSGSSWMLVSIQINSLDFRFSLTAKKCHPDEPLEVSCSKFSVLVIFPC